MPIIKTKSGYKFGKEGKEYTGKNAKDKAEKQRKAIEANKHKKKRA